MSFHAVQYIQRDLRVFCRCAALQVFLLAAFEAELFRRDRIRLIPAVLDLADSGRRAEGDFVQLVLSVHNHAPFYAQTGENPGQGLRQIAVVHAQQLHGRRSRVGQRSQNVEHRAETQFFTNRAHIFHGRVILLGEEEAHARFLQQLHTPCRALVDIDSQRLQAVRRPAQGGRRPVAVLGHLHASRRRNQRRSGRDVKALGVVTAGTHDFKHIHARFHSGCMGPHGSSAAGNFIRRLRPGAFRGESGQKRRVLRSRSFPAHNLVHHRVSFFVSQVLFAYYLDDGLFNHFPIPLICFLNTDTHPIWTSSYELQAPVQKAQQKTCPRI